MENANPFVANSIVWPLVFILSWLIVFRQVHQDIRPVLTSIIGGVAKNAQSNATSYAIAIMFGLSASFSAFWEVFHNLEAAALMKLSWHQYAALWTKVANPFIVAVLAYATQNNFKPAVPTQ